MYEKPASEGVSANSSRTGTVSKPTRIFDLPDLRVFRLDAKGKTGNPVGMLDAVLTGDVPKESRLGRYALLLDAKGRIQTDLIVVRDGDGLVLISEDAGARATMEILGRYAPFSRVKLQQSDLAVMGVYGPEAGRITGANLSANESARMELAGADVLIVGSGAPFEGVIVIAEPDSLRPITDYLEEHGAVRETFATYETERILAAVPRFGADITPNNFPAEAHLEERAVDFSKGCYPGQETVARMHYRGQPNKRLHRFVIEGETTPGTPIFQDGKEAGYITSIAPLKVDGNIYALGYLKRKADLEAELVADEATLKVSRPEGNRDSR